MVKWKSYKNKQTGDLCIEVSSSTQTIIATVRPHKAREMTKQEFERLITSLMQSVEKNEKKMVN